MKTIILLLAITVISCSKSKVESRSAKTCWECNVSATQTVQGCTDDGSLPHLSDPNGNAYALWNCKKI